MANLKWTWIIQHFLKITVIIYISFRPSAPEIKVNFYNIAPTNE